MPVIDISLTDLKKLVGDKFPKNVEELEPHVHNLKGEIETVEGDAISIKLGDANRPDLWCAEGVARELKGLLGAAQGIPKYAAHPSNYRVIVNGKLEKVRGYIACAVITGLKLSDLIIKQIMQQQEKIDASYGRNRKKTSIGLYNFDSLKWPLKYTMTKPHENEFVPLGFSEKLSPHEILKQHPKGQEYGNLLKGLSEYPIFLDSENKVLSMPPVINSNDLGQVNEQTENVLVEVTGTDYESANQVLRIIAMGLADRGGKIYEVKIDYPYRKIDTTPQFESKKISIGIPKANELLGTKFDAADITKLLRKMRYNLAPVSETENIPHSLEIEIPCYRSDIMHPVDIYEDIAIAYGLNKFEREPLALPTSGKLSEQEKLSNKARELCIGLGAQEILNFTLTNKDNLFRLMTTKEENVIEIENPVSFTFSCLRNKLLPSLLEFLSKNTTKEFPQKVFEVGDIVYPDAKADEKSVTERRLAFAVSHPEATFTEARQALEAIFTNLGIKIAVKETEHESFIAGRCAAVWAGKERIGLVGEVHPQVLKNWGLEMPTVCFEIRL